MVFVCYYDVLVYILETIKATETIYIIYNNKFGQSYYWFLFWLGAAEKNHLKRLPIS